MKTFLKRANGKSVFVPVGFSWPAFVFRPLWALAKRQWLLFFLLTLALIPLNLVLDLAESSENPVFILLGCALLISYMVVCGLYGNRWLKHSLESKGYKGEGSI